MFGLGYIEIGIILLLLILLFGGRRTGYFLGRAFGIYKKVDETTSVLKKPFSLSTFLGIGKK